jgi:hypothetical protein
MRSKCLVNTQDQTKIKTVLKSPVWSVASSCDALNINYDKN